ncbi:hypothetical protein AL036_05795 [Salipiger aestuarii]|nr:hypothetical protein AL036_05795 [Salipiger aestuarii]
MMDPAPPRAKAGVADHAGGVFGVMLNVAPPRPTRASPVAAKASSRCLNGSLGEDWLAEGDPP